MGDPNFAKVFRCEACCEGNQVNPEREMRTIINYLHGFIPAATAAQGVGG